MPPATRSRGSSCTWSSLAARGPLPTASQKITRSLAAGPASRKAEVCLQLAQYLSLLQIETLEDFRAFPSQELLEIVVRAVKGLGAAGTSYLFMLAGDENRCKPDVHIHHCIRDACGLDVSDESCQSLFADAVALLRPQYPQLTVRGLDSVIWRRYQSA